MISLFSSSLLWSIGVFPMRSFQLFFFCDRVTPAWKVIFICGFDQRLLYDNDMATRFFFFVTYISILILASVKLRARPYLHSADVFNFQIIKIILIWNILVHNFFFVDLSVKIDIYDTLHLMANLLGLHRLKLVCVLAEGICFLSKIYFDVWDVADLICSQNSKNTLFFDRLERSTLKVNQI